MVWNVECGHRGGRDTENSSDDRRDVRLLPQRIEEHEVPWDGGLYGMGEPRYSRGTMAGMDHRHYATDSRRGEYMVLVDYEDGIITTMLDQAMGREMINKDAHHDASREPRQGHQP